MLVICYSYNVYMLVYIVIVFMWRISQARLIQNPHGQPNRPGTTFENQSPSPTTNTPTTNTTTTNTTTTNTPVMTDKPDVTTDEDIKNDAESGW